MTKNRGGPTGPPILLGWEWPWWPVNGHGGRGRKMAGEEENKIMGGIFLKNWSGEERKIKKY